MSTPLRMLALILALSAAVPATAAFVEPLQMSDAQFTVFYWPGDEAVARESLDVLRECVQTLATRLPAGSDKINVTICRSLNEFRQIAGRYGQAWVGGVTHFETGAIAVKAPYILPERGSYASILRHELIHVLLAHNTNEANLPRWFNEGVAMMASGEFRWGSPARVARMYSTANLIPYYKLDFALMDAGNETLSSDAYAEALSLARFLQDRLGQEKFWDLVRAMRDLPFEDALKQASGLTPGDLYIKWHASLWKVAVITAAASAFTAFDLMVLLAFLAWYRKRQSNKVIIQQWLDEELERMVDGPGWEPSVYSPPEWTDEDEDP